MHSLESKQEFKNFLPCKNGRKSIRCIQFHLGDTQGLHDVAWVKRLHSVCLREHFSHAWFNYEKMWLCSICRQRRPRSACAFGQSWIPLEAECSSWLHDAPSHRALHYHFITILRPLRGRQHSFVEIDHEIFSMVILSLLLIQEGQLSVSGERMRTILVNRLEDKACPANVWLGKLTALDMAPLGWLGRKTSTQTIKHHHLDLTTVMLIETSNTKASICQGLFCSLKESVITFEYKSHNRREHSFWHKCPKKIQISARSMITPHCQLCILGYPKCTSADSDQTAQMCFLKLQLIPAFSRGPD